MSSNLLLKKITIFLTVDENTIDSYFNAHDPSPLYKRQLSQDFEEYLMSSVVAIKRYSTLRYRLVCTKESDKEFVEPLIHAIRRHYSIQKAIKEAEFKRYKKRSFTLLGISFSIVLLCFWVIPIFVKSETGLIGSLKEASHVLSWVMMWKPIEKLIFNWNPHLKEISIHNRLTNAEIIINLKQSAQNGATVMPGRKYA
jgi:hypothetical protein